MVTSNATWRKKVLAVFTFRPVSEILKDRGSQAWALKPENARRCRYIVCTRNRDRWPDEAGPEEHGAAFLVGKITVVEPSPERPDRFIVRFDEYALLDPQPVVWPGSRNPVWYLDSLADLGINEASLVWQPVPQEVEGEQTPEPDVAPITSPFTAKEARAALATIYGVKPEDVQISIRL